MKSGKRSDPATDDLAFGKQRGSQLGTEFAAALGIDPSAKAVPAWVKSACAAVIKGLWPDMLKSPAKCPGPKEYGELVALMLDRLKFYQARTTQPVTHDALELKNACHFLEWFIHGALVEMLRLGSDEQVAGFYEGFSDILKRRAEGTLVLGTDATTVYVALLIFRHEVSRCKSVPAVYRMLKEKNALDGRSLATFEKNCQRIGLRLGNPGRPRQKK